VMGCGSPLKSDKNMSASVLKSNPNKNRTVEQVTKACKEKTENRFASTLRSNNLPFPPKHMELLAFKEERKLEVYANKILLHAYDFTAYSGKRGPKTKEGDRQIPEGIYQVEYLNPNSQYHISIKINYPNARDMARAKNAGIEKPGSDIFIHGKELSIGCIPIGDAYIEEVFTLVAMTGIENVRVLIFPNDARKNGKFLPCEICPADTEELYAELKKELVTY
jgi:murein L,D-transpeptidase YafK